jgi:hypothetical protein
VRKTPLTIFFELKFSTRKSIFVNFFLNLLICVTSRSTQDAARRGAQVGPATGPAAGAHGNGNPRRPTAIVRQLAAGQNPEAERPSRSWLLLHWYVFFKHLLKNRF